MPRRAFAPGLTLILLLVTCSSEEPVTLESFLAQYPEVYCSYLMRCCDQAERSFGSKEACLQATTAAAEEILAFRGASTPFATFLPGPAKRCLEGLRLNTCTDEPQLASGCIKETIQPGHKSGEECTFSVECESYYCNQPQKNVQGSCSAAGGAQCSGDDRACMGGATCNASRQCVLRVEDSRPCAGPNECQSGICSPQYKTCFPRPNPFCDGK